MIRSSDPHHPVSAESTLAKNFRDTRKLSVSLCQPLEIEDYVVQPVEDVSPPKWHLGHTTWFFEALVLKPYREGYTEFHPDFSYIFNSYYESVGDRVLRPRRGLMSRPSVDEVMAYREYVDGEMNNLLSQVSPLSDEVFDIIEIGIHHEQQHQELLITDIKYILGSNPLFPVYREITPGPKEGQAPEGFLSVDEGLYQIGHSGADFCYDNELGCHKVFLQGFRCMDRLITNQEYLEFITAGGYKDFRHWLSDGWTWVNQNGVNAPRYWHQKDGFWHHYTLSGFRLVHPSEPVTHVSFYEADAYARWRGKRLLNEFEWEVACQQAEPRIPESANFVDSTRLHPSAKGLQGSQFYGDVWEWTNSAYLPYPNFQTKEGALGEYNGKFMINQMVLRGGSCATSRNHIRPTYRNFFHPHLRWQFTGIRLAEYA